MVFGDFQFLWLWKAADRRSIEMAHARGGDFMFCDLCGTMMFLYSKEHVECPLCKFKKSAKGMAHDHLFSSKQQQPACMLNAFIDFIVVLVFGLYLLLFLPSFLTVTYRKQKLNAWLVFDVSQIRDRIFPVNFYIRIYASQMIILKLLTAMPH